jgi:putative nucleotidyltransferase with HDIG domain
MKAVADQDMIDVDALCVGMFVHLDLSWMSHPFPLGSFKIANAEQIETIRSLGLARLRWNRAQSDVVATSTGRWASSGAVGAVDAAGPVGVDNADGADTPGPATSPEPAVSPEVAARAAHKRAISDQREALALCERQFTEASHDFKRLNDLVVSKPQDARVQAEALSKALVDKMLGEQDLCVRLLTDAAGDKASMHALNVTIISMLMGRTFGLSEPDMQDLGVGAMLHDIGKIELPERVRHRDESLSPSEVRFYEEHVAHGVALARKMGLAPGAMLVLAQHHEHADGSGFPLRLNTDRMTAGARIVALVNRYDNLCNPHFAARALTPHESLSLLFAQGKSKFDTAILGAFIRMMGVYPAGSTVQLTDDRYAMVVGVNSSRPLKPRVLVHERGVPREEALIVDLEGAQGVGIRRSIKPMQLPVESLEYLSPRPRVAYFFEPVRLAYEAALAA